MGDLRGGSENFLHRKRKGGGGGAEMLPERRGENLKYLTSKNIKSSFLQSNKAV